MVSTSRKYMQAAMLLGAAGLVTACADISRSRDLANPAVASLTLAQQVCSNCHGLAGSATSPNFPNLAGQIEPYVVAQLTEFRSHDRRDPAGFQYMWGLSRSLTDTQIAGLAAYYSQQRPVKQRVEGSAARIAAGKLVFHKGVADQGVPACAGCHGPLALGQAGFPRLASQHADYLVKQLIVFQRTDDRPEGNIMKTVAHALTKDNVEDVAAYLQSLQGP